MSRVLLFLFSWTCVLKVRTFIHPLMNSPDSRAQREVLVCSQLPKQTEEQLIQ
jgi:hypothetical protein